MRVSQELRGFYLSVDIGVKTQGQNAKRSQSGENLPLLPQVTRIRKGVKGDGNPKKKICTVDSCRDNGNN